MRSITPAGSGSRTERLTARALNIDLLPGPASARRDLFDSHFSTEDARTELNSAARMRSTWLHPRRESHLVQAVLQDAAADAVCDLPCAGMAQKKTRHMGGFEGRRWKETGGETRGLNWNPSLEPALDPARRRACAWRDRRGA